MGEPFFFSSLSSAEKRSHTDVRTNSMLLYGIPVYSYRVGVPGGLVGGPRAYEDQFRGFKSHRVNARGFFLQKKKMISGKRESAS